MTTITVETIRAALVEGAILTGKAHSLQEQVNGRREGAYTSFMRAAAAAGTAEVFEPAIESVLDEIRRTGRVKADDGKAYSVGAKPNKKGDGFTVPGSLSVAKSVILGAMAYSIALVDDAGNPRTFGSVRKDKEVADKAKRDAAMTGDDLLRQRAKDLAAAFLSNIADAQGDKLARGVKALEVAIQAFASPTTIAVSKGEEIAKAA